MNSTPIRLLQQAIWSSYGGYSGWKISGEHPMPLPNQDASQEEKQLYVVSRAEGFYDSVNCYDRGICSVGILQMTEANGLVSKLLNSIEENYLGKEWLLQCFQPWYDLEGFPFWKMVPANKSKAILKCDGKTNSWTPLAKEYNKAFVICMSNVFTDKLSQSIQNKMNYEILESFIWTNGKAWRTSLDKHNPESMAALAVFLSFANNLPAVANKFVPMAHQKAGEAGSQGYAQRFLNCMVEVSGVHLWKSRVPETIKAIHDVWGV